MSVDAGNKRRRFSSLRSRIGLVVVLAVIPGFVISIIAVNDERNSSKDEAQRAAVTIAGSTAARYQSLLRESQSLLQVLRNIPSTVYDEEACSTVLKTVIEDSATYENMFILNADGQVVCGRDEDRGQPPIRADWFETALTQDTFVVAETEPGESPIYPLMITAYGVGEGTDRYVLASEFSLEALGDVIGDSFPEGATVTMLDRDDVVMYRGPGPSEFIGKSISNTDIVQKLRDRGGEGVITARGTDDVKRLYAYRTLTQPDGAAIYAGIPTSVAFAGATHDFRVRLIWLAIGALIALLIALTIADLTIGRRVRSLVGVTRQIGAGNLSARSDVGTGDEVGDLGKALDVMAAELRARDEERAQLLTKLVDASEEERRRIAGDVHDDSIQVMSAQVMGLQLLRRRVDDPELKARIQELEESGREATARLRDLVFYLHSPTLETHGLASAIDLLLDRSFEGETVEWSVDSALAEDPPPASRDTAYRIAQEAIGNARRHARAAHITVDLRRDGNELVMTIVDDGVGFSPDGQADRPGHLGLRAARERAAAVGGAVVIDSAVGGGTRFACRLPWNFDAVATPPNGERAAVTTDP